MSGHTGKDEREPRCVCGGRKRPRGPPAVPPPCHRRNNIPPMTWRNNGPRVLGRSYTLTTSGRFRLCGGCCWGREPEPEPRLSDGNRTPGEPEPEPRLSDGNRIPSATGFLSAPFYHDKSHHRNVDFIQCPGQLPRFKRPTGLRYVVRLSRRCLELATCDHVGAGATPLPYRLYTRPFRVSS